MQQPVRHDDLDHEYREHEKPGDPEGTPLHDQLPISK
jgi:hypothetical protein